MKQVSKIQYATQYTTEKQYKYNPKNNKPKIQTREYENIISYEH
jgi:hypothetical protein